MENGTLSNVDVDPVILKEILYPENPPNEKIVMLLEACFAAYNEGRIVFALRNLEEAKEEWADAPGGVTSLDMVFFDFLKGSIYETACRDDLALQSYERCFKSSQKLDLKHKTKQNANGLVVATLECGAKHPDKALPFLGMGSVLYSSCEYDLAARCFKEAKEIRERYLGPDCADTASVYNNLACCLIKLGRATEAFKLLRLAEVIFEAELGLFHDRTRTAKQNKDKAVRDGLDSEVAFRPMWQFFYNDAVSKIGVGGVKAEKKKVTTKKK